MRPEHQAVEEIYNMKKELCLVVSRLAKVTFRVVVDAITKFVVQQVLVQVVLVYTVTKLQLNNTPIGLPSVACVVWLICVSACQPSGPEYRVVESEFVEFGGLFTAVDTVRFDASVLIGEIGFVDLSDHDEFLVTDYVVRMLYVFTASGHHVRTIDMSRCNPEDDGELRSAKFLSNGKIIATSPWGIYTINKDGSCEERLLEISPNSPSFCERNDTIYFMNRVAINPVIQAYSLESGDIQEYDIRRPKFPRLTGVKAGIFGREITCFEKNIFYRYAESSDGEPLWIESNSVIHQPISYQSPERDLKSQGMSNITLELRKLAHEFTYSEGIFELDQNHRMIKFQYPTDINLSIINMDTETSVSTTIDDFIIMAKDGLMYVIGDYEQLPSGEMGNRMLYVWQFHPFASHSKTSDE